MTKSLSYRWKYFQKATATTGPSFSGSVGKETKGPSVANSVTSPRQQCTQVSQPASCNIETHWRCVCIYDMTCISHTANCECNLVFFFFFFLLMLLAASPNWEYASVNESSGCDRPELRLCLTWVFFSPLPLYHSMRFVLSQMLWLAKKNVEIKEKVENWWHFKSNKVTTKVIGLLYFFLVIVHLFDSWSHTENKILILHKSLTALWKVH